MPTGIVEPIDPNAAPAIPPEEAVSPTDENAEKVEDGEGLPPALLKIPSIVAMLAGSPPATSAPIQEFSKRPEAKVISKNKDDLMNAGFGFYRSLGGDLGVMFNQMFITGEEIQRADKESRLQEVAPPFDVVAAEVSKSGKGHPALNPKQPRGSGVPPAPAASEGVLAAPPGPQATTPSAPASVQRNLLSARVRNMAPGAPTSGSQPGSGRLLNSILKPVI